jgi:hypothetical protein
MPESFPTNQNAENKGGPKRGYAFNEKVENDEKRTKKGKIQVERQKYYRNDRLLNDERID